MFRAWCVFYLDWTSLERYFLLWNYHGNCSRACRNTAVCCLQHSLRRDDHLIPPGTGSEASLWISAVWGQTCLLSPRFKEKYALSKWDSNFAHFTNIQVNVQNYRQAGRPFGWSGTDATRSCTEFTQFQWLRQKRFFQHDHKTKTQIQ